MPPWLDGPPLVLVPQPLEPGPPLAGPEPAAQGQHAEKTSARLAVGTAAFAAAVVGGHEGVGS